MLFIVSDEELITLEIYNHNKRKELIYFSKIVEIFKNQIAKKDISKIVDKLFDMCIIYATWETINDKWVRAIYIDDDYVECFREFGV